MKNFFQKTKTFVTSHKAVSIVAAVLIIFGGYKTFAAKTTSAASRYVVGTVQRGLIVSTVTGSGQISASDQINVTAKVSGTLTWVGVKVGDTVYAGQGIAAIDDTTAKQQVVDAEASLAAAKLQYQKDQAQAPISYQQSVDALATAQTDLQTEYNNTFNALSTTYLDLPNVVSGMDSILHGFDLSISRNQENKDILIGLFNTEANAKVLPFEQKAESDYLAARAIYDPALNTFKSLTRSADPNTLDSTLSQSIDTVTAIAQALQSQLTFLGEVTDLGTQYNVKIPANVATFQTNDRSYLSTVNSDLSTLLNEKKTLTTNKQNIVTDQQNITLLQVGNTAGNDPISLQISQNSITKQEEDLAALKANLADYSVVAPFSGTVTAVTAVRGDTANGTLATIITQQQIAQLSLNEVDAAKVKVGDKTTLTFDALSDLSLTGTVAQIDPVGTVTQGVVSYTVKISLDSQDPRVKPGMTVNASIQTDVRPDVLYVPSSAVKTTNGTTYVQVFDPAIDAAALATAQGTTETAGVTSPTPPQQVQVQTGISDDTNIEIVSGLTEGQQIVTRTVTGTAATGAKTTTTAAATTRGAGGFGGGATGGIRIP